MARFDLALLKDYLQGGFERGYDFKPEYTGKQLVETQRSGGCFVKMDFNGAPVLKDEFVDYMDSNDFGVCVSAQRIADIIESLRCDEPQSAQDEKRRALHATAAWICHHNRKGVTQEVFAEKMSVDVRTVRRWQDQLLRYVANAINAEPERPAFLIGSMVFAPMLETGAA